MSSGLLASLGPGMTTFNPAINQWVAVGRTYLKREKAQIASHDRIAEVRKSTSGRMAS